MFANPLWSLAILAGLCVMYGIIRWKHGGPLLSASMTWPEWVVRFRTWVASLVYGLGVSLPDILVLITPFDFSPYIGENYAKLLTLAFGLFGIINAGLKTKRDGERVA
jgi:hypothetical protein